MAVPIQIPLINPNEPEALLSALEVREGQHIATGDLICTLETTKSAVDVTAEQSGYLVGLRFQVGDTLQAGDVLGYLADTPDWTPPEDPLEATNLKEHASTPDRLRITQPGLVLARQHNLDLSQLPQDRLVTADTVRAVLAGEPEAAFTLPKGGFDPQAMVIYGAGGHGKSVLEMVNALGSYRVVGFIDDGVPAGAQVMGLPVLGGEDALSGLYGEGIRLAANAVGGIGNLRIRQKVFHNLLAAGFGCPAIVHPEAFVEASARLSAGVQVFPHAYVGSEVQVGFGAIINTGALVSHDCVLGECANLSPGAILAGEVRIGNYALVGMGVTVNLQARVGDWARVGNGATILRDVPDHGVVPAGSIWPRS